MPLGDTAQALGLGIEVGATPRSFGRSVAGPIRAGPDGDRGAANWRSRKLPPLSRRQMARLSPTLQAAHERWQADQLKRAIRPRRNAGGRQLALSLLELGEDVEEAERQLLRWRYHPALAHEATIWAAEAIAAPRPPRRGRAEPAQGGETGRVRCDPAGSRAAAGPGHCRRCQRPAGPTPGRTAGGLGPCRRGQRPAGPNRGGWGRSRAGLT